MADVTKLLAKIESGDRAAAEQLLPLVYDELRQLAGHKMAGEKPDQTLQATALVHEAYLRLVGPQNQHLDQAWDGRKHFFAAAAEAMRRILVDNARRKSRVKHGGDRERVPLDDVQPAVSDSPDELLRINDALEQLAVEDATAARVVELCYFGGFSVEDAAEVLEISRATAYRCWTYAKAWLHSEIRRDE